MTEPELKPCPFCGGEAELKTEGSGSGNAGMQVCSTYRFVVCTLCSSRTSYERSTISAIKIWNERDHTAAVKDMMKKIEDVNPEIKRAVNGFINEFQRVLNAMIDTWLEAYNKKEGL